jgi:hypothetical protein
LTANGTPANGSDLGGDPDEGAKLLLEFAGRGERRIGDVARRALATVHVVGNLCDRHDGIAHGCPSTAAYVVAGSSAETAKLCRACMSDRRAFNIPAVAATSAAASGMPKISAAMLEIISVEIEARCGMMMDLCCLLEFRLQPALLDRRGNSSPHITACNATSDLNRSRLKPELQPCGGALANYFDKYRRGISAPAT